MKAPPRSLILASSSPRRRELLPLLGLPFEVVPPDVAELSAGDPVALVAANAERKARAVAAGAGDAVVVGCDTDVVLDGAALGKPDSADAARERLRALSGRAHQVHSGVFVLGPAGGRGGVETTAVRFRELQEAEIDAYVRTGEWEGRAGAYAVQGFGSSLIAAVDGDLSNVIGLPLPLLGRLIAGLHDG